MIEIAGDFVGQDLAGVLALIDLGFILLFVWVVYWQATLCLRGPSAGGGPLKGKPDSARV